MRVPRGTGEEGVDELQLAACNVPLPAKLVFCHRIRPECGAVKED